MSGGKIQQLELGAPVNLGRRFDWVMSIEVGEHIPVESEDIFMDNVIRHACKGGLSVDYGDTLEKDMVTRDERKRERNMD